VRDLTRKDKNYVVRTINWEKNKLVNICDKELIGCTLKEGPLLIYISSEYFNGEIVDSEEAIKLIKDSKIANLVGNRIVLTALNKNLASELAVKKIDSTLFLMIFK
jgi:hypothetical protein